MPAASQPLSSHCISRPGSSGCSGSSRQRSSTACAMPSMIRLHPGGYRFGDFVRLGVPFTLLVLALTVVVVPLLFPF